LKTRSAEFDFQVQIRDIESVPTSEIENATTPPPKNIPYISIGRIFIP
jgi:hypothetical protein